MTKIRIDQLIYQNGLSESREQAKIYIMEGRVFTNGILVTKPSQEFTEDAEITITPADSFASRGGFKLAKALESFCITVQNLEIMDIGASTGGFTDCLLKNGAKKVYSIDVGYGQLSWKLRNDERVKVMEKTNARYLEPKDIGGPAEGAVIDVSFISLKHIIPAVERCVKFGSFFIALIKPQFEAGKGIAKNGVIKDAGIHENVLTDICGFINHNSRYKVIGLDYSPIKGPKGNIEYLVYCRDDKEAMNINIKNVVNSSHNDLMKEKK